MESVVWGGCLQVMVVQSWHLLHPGRACGHQGALVASSPPTHELEGERFIIQVGAWDALL